ncbi:MAG: NAD-binding protein [Planctomycetes bacterium]|nr:NAD-binding protein [Planctomycetota bacterium]
MGQTVKAAIQLLVSIHVIAAAEAFALAQKAGVDPEMLAEIVGLSVGTSRMFELKAPKIMNRDFSNSGALDIQIKDLNICLAMGRELNVPLFLAAASRELYIMAEGMGYGREDLSAVVKLYEQASGVPVAKKQ